MSLERIIITLTKEGKFRGASATDFDDVPVPLDQTGLEAIVPTLNTAALARVTELETQLSALTGDRDLAHGKLDEIAAKVSAATPDTIDTVKVEVATAVDEGKKSATEKEIAALQAQIAAEQAKLAELQSKV